MKLLALPLVILAVTAVAIADVCLKKAALSGTLASALKSPWMIGAVALYLFQIFFFTYLFVSGTELLYVGILQTALYAAIVLTAGFLLFHESLSAVQMVGMVLALVGAILMNTK
jgi:drug/metabolite transporter (DMT)-like permease